MAEKQSFSSGWDLRRRIGRHLRMRCVLSQSISPVTQSMESTHGKKYIVDGRIETPTGKVPIVRTVWIIDRGETVPRLVTAYPHEE